VELGRIVEPTTSIVWFLGSDMVVGNTSHRDPPRRY
jgi:hypothetical protein